MSHFHSNTLLGSSGNQGYEIERSLRFNRPDTAYLGFTPSSAGNQRTWTWSAWLKRSRVSVSGDYYYLFTPNGDSVIRFNDNDTLEFYDTGGSKGRLVTNQLFRDVSAWYHIVYVVDTTVSSPSSDRLKLYVNGERVTSFSTESYPSQNVTLGWNAAVAHSLGRWELYAAQYFDGYMTEVNFIDGAALTPSDFGETDTETGAWIPKKYSGSYGTNGFYLNFSDNSSVSALGTDTSGNGNNWTPNNFSVTAGAGNDSLEDSPTNNYATWSPLDNFYSSHTLSEGNLRATTPIGANYAPVKSTFGMSTGKWYWECVDSTGTGSSAAQFGIVQTVNTNDYLAAQALSVAYWGTNGQVTRNTSLVTTAATFNQGDVIAFAFDADALTLAIYKNNTLQTTVTGITAGVWFAAGGDNTSIGGNYKLDANFGQRAFAYTPPTGYKALNTANLPVPTIKDGSDYFNTVLYTGNSSTQSITGVGFQPDLVWIKQRNAAENHFLTDVIRGAGIHLRSDSTVPENDDSATFTAFTSDGFSLTGSGPAMPQINDNTDTYVAWNWLAGGSSSSNTDGSIASQVSANQTAGFSIATYTATGSTGSIGHGLGKTPSFVITKHRNLTTHWRIWHKSLIAYNYTLFFNTGAQQIQPAYSALPTSSVINLDGDLTGAYDFVTYSWAEIEGYSKFGSYTGNGSTDGPFVHCGFRPAMIWTKRADGISNWYEFDDKRNPYNLTDNKLELNSNGAEFDGYNNNHDLLSNGFKLRSSDAGSNGSGGTYIFAAWAVNPFKYANAR